MLTAYYDLARSPPTYDVISFLCAVERERLRLGENDVEIVFLPGPRDGFRDDQLWPFTTAERVDMRDRVAMPICWLLPAVRSVEFWARPKSLRGFGVGQARHMWIELVQACQLGIRPLRLPSSWPSSPDPGLVTITLRESEHWPERNSLVPVWLGVAEQIERAFGKRVVFVRDTARAYEPLPDSKSDQHAPFHIGDRAALYRNAFCNLFVSNGPAWLSIMLDAPTLIFKPTLENSMFVFSEKFFEHCGVVGRQLPCSPSYQRLVWCNDHKVEPIVAAFRQFSKDHA